MDNNNKKYFKPDWLGVQIDLFLWIFECHLHWTEQILVDHLFLPLVQTLLPAMAMARGDEPFKSKFIFHNPEINTILWILGPTGFSTMGKLFRNSGMVNIWCRPHPIPNLDICQSMIPLRWDHFQKVLLLISESDPIKMWFDFILCKTTYLVLTFCCCCCFCCCRLDVANDAEETWLKGILDSRIRLRFGSLTVCSKGSSSLAN